MYKTILIIYRADASSHSPGANGGERRLAQYHTISHQPRSIRAAIGGEALIRWKRPHDLHGIVRLVRTQLVPLSPWAHPRDGRLRDEIEDRLRAGYTLVAAKSRFSEPFGFLHLVVQDSSLFIDLLAVDPDQQNRHWGTELMKRAEEFGRANGCRTAYLYVDEGNYRGQRFYKRRGYVITQYVKELHCYRMEKLIVHPFGEWLAPGGKISPQV